MDVMLRPGSPEDATTCGAICYEAFKAIASQHNFPPDFSARAVAVDLLRLWLSHPLRATSVVVSNLVLSNSCQPSTAHRYCNRERQPCMMYDSYLQLVMHVHDKQCWPAAVV